MTDASPPDDLPVRRSRWLARGLAALVVAWAVVVVVLVRFLGDRWWVGTLALFAPRWLLLAPLVVGALVWPWAGRWARWSLLASALIAWWGVSGFCVPLGGWGALPGWGVKPKMVYRIVTCNVAGTAVDPLALETLIADSRADIVVLQEYTASGAITFPDDWSHEQRGNLLDRVAFSDRQYHRRQSGPAGPMAAAGRLCRGGGYARANPVRWPPFICSALEKGWGRLLIRGW